VEKTAQKIVRWSQRTNPTVDRASPIEHTKINLTEKIALQSVQTGRMHSMQAG